MKFKVEYDSAPIRHIAIQHAKCGNWFRLSDLTKTRVTNESDLRSFVRDIQSLGSPETIVCPKCNTFFEDEDFEDNFESKTNIEITECNSASEVYKDCLSKKVSWE